MLLKNGGSSSCPPLRSRVLASVARKSSRGRGEPIAGVNVPLVLLAVVSCSLAEPMSWLVVVAAWSGSRALPRFVQNTRVRASTRAHLATRNRTVRDVKGSGVSGFRPVLNRVEAITGGGSGEGIAIAGPATSQPLEDDTRRSWLPKIVCPGDPVLETRGRFARGRTVVVPVTLVVGCGWSRESRRVEPHGHEVGNASVPGGSSWWWSSSSTSHVAEPRRGPASCCVLSAGLFRRYRCRGRHRGRDRGRGRSWFAVVSSRD